MKVKVVDQSLDLDVLNDNTARPFLAKQHLINTTHPVYYQVMLMIHDSLVDVSQWISYMSEIKDIQVIKSKNRMRDCL